MDVFGIALTDYYQNRFRGPLILHNSYGEAEEMPVEVFFREEEDLPGLERFALTSCRGRILDAGAGAGSHARILQDRGQDVTAVEISAAAVRIMRERGVGRVIRADIWEYQGEKYDTMLMMMNGIGLVETLERLRTFLRHARQLVRPDGQLLLDSSDISYLYEEVRKPAHYFGEIRYRYEYQGLRGDWFGWLYVDRETLFDIARKEGWLMQVIYENDEDQYLARLVMTETPR
ncbi:MAG TPA: methyltransferase domain-containing protein [Sphingobacteriaceae bacterium]